MDPKDDTIDIIFVPYMAPGHMMPMVDIARQFSSHGVKSTIITTATNAARFKNVLNRDAGSGRRIAFHMVSLPLEEVGLPPGCENLIAAPTPESAMKLHRAIEKVQPQMESFVIQHCPDAIVSDVLYPWTVDLAEKLGIPRIAFSGSCFFSDCVAHCVREYRPHEGIESESQEFLVPTLPDNIVLKRSQLPDLVKGKTDFDELFERLREAERRSFGVLYNSFYELEPAYADYFRKEMKRRAWHIGPLSLFNRELDDKAERGDRTSVNAHKCLSWLNIQEPNSVLYICFGSLTRFIISQLVEIASALEDSRHSFIWVVGKVHETGEGSEADEWWLPEGFEEKMEKNGRGMIIRGWAPQVLILDHPAIGGFLTHCGWNSILEGVCAGVPLITWPIFAEQFYNEKIVTQVLKFGVGVGNETWKVWATQGSPVIEKEKIKRAISIIMDRGDEGEEMREKAKKLSELANKAVEEGGSSYNDMKALLENIRRHRN
ncbi:Scopoletin glucosyltransferase-like protein [Drosera capensis]